MQIPARQAVVSSPEYPFARVYAPIKLDQNESPDDFPSDLKNLVLERLSAAQWNRYTELNSESLCESIARNDGWDGAGVVMTTGSNVLISLLIQMTALNGRVVTVKPNFSLYGLQANLLGANLTEVPLHADFSINVDLLIEELGKPQGNQQFPAGVIYIPQPHAPTGSMIELKALESLALASEGWLLVIDEAYHQFAQTSLIDFAKQFPHVVLLRTFSKAWGLAGLRMGYALASVEVARNLRKLVPPFAVSVMQTIAVDVALANPDYVRVRVANTVRERERMYVILSQHPTWNVIPSNANFLLIRTPDASQTFTGLLENGILVRRQDGYFGLEGCIRVTIGNKEENDAFLRAARMLP